MNLFQRYKKYPAGKLLPVTNRAILTQRAFSALIIFLSAFVFVSANAQNSNNVLLVGKVSDEKTKEPLPGAVVHIKGTTHNVVANEEGEFTFITGQKVPVVYEVSHVGYETREVTVNSYGHIDIRLKGNNAQLNDVVVVGYGTQKRSDVAGAVTSVPK